MAKLYFRYGAMNSGKSTSLMQVAYNYEERGQKVIVIKSIIDTKGDKCLVSRIGLKREVDILLKEKDEIFSKGKQFKKDKIACILVDEAQFLNPDQVFDLYKISKIYDIPVICYGLRSDFKTNGFPGSLRLLEIADELEELVTICSCGSRATLNARKVNNEFVNQGDQVSIDEVGDVTYESLCGKCYLEKVMGKSVN
ncbi:MAG: thymidine kinase [Bacilli bacterium]|nr:thymidine kinase [Bacilli bacterium]MDD4808444.1 thymidine kinase [Bacilli bacterium]